MQYIAVTRQLLQMCTVKKDPDCYLNSAVSHTIPP